MREDNVRTGSSNLGQRPIYAHGGLCVGILVCRDIECVEFAHAVIDSVRTNPAPIKLVCIPADMGSQWFGNNPIERLFGGVHVAMCNGMRDARSQSFLADDACRKRQSQLRHEPIRAELPFA